MSFKFSSEKRTEIYTVNITQVFLSFLFFPEIFNKITALIFTVDIPHYSWATVGLHDHSLNDAQLCSVQKKNANFFFFCIKKYKLI